MEAVAERLEKDDTPVHKTSGIWTEDPQILKKEGQSEVRKEPEVLVAYFGRRVIQGGKEVHDGIPVSI